MFVLCFTAIAVVQTALQAANGKLCLLLPRDVQTDLHGFPICIGFHDNIKAFLAYGNRHTKLT